MFTMGWVSMWEKSICKHVHMCVGTKLKSDVPLDGFPLCFLRQILSLNKDHQFSLVNSD